MAGHVRILKEGEILFRTGEKAESMYIVRRGSLKVYFLKGNEEVQLALLNDGAIVGEMAFFDQKPRSAHVKALAQTEITEITRADFDKLLTQIPKWLVTMLQSLSGRLRTTNEKLAVIEKAQQGGSQGAANDYPFVPLVRTLRIFQLLINQFGQKDGATLVLDYQSTLDWWMSLTGWSRDYFSKFVAVCEKQGLLTKKGDDNRSPRLVISGRARMQLFTDFMIAIQSRATSESVENFGPQWIAVFEAGLADVASSGYEAYNVSVSSLPSGFPGIPTDPKFRLQIAEWLAQWLQLKNTKSNTDVILRLSQKEHKNTPVLLKILNSYVSEKLDRIG